MTKTTHTMTKKDEQFALNQAKETIQKEFVKFIGFAPSKKDIHPLECSYEYFKPEWTDDGLWIVTTLGFHIGGLGYALDDCGHVTRAEWYDMNQDK